MAFIVGGLVAIPVMITEVVPPEVRGISFSVTGFLGAIAGAASPLAIGLLADQFEFVVDGEVKGNLANAFLIVTPLVFVGAMVLLQGRRHVAGDLEAVRLPACSRTGRCLMPPMKLRAQAVGRAEAPRPWWTRLASSSNSTWISMRASWAPRQKCGPPPPKAMCVVRGAGDVEPERVVEDVLVAVGRDVPEADLVAVLDRLAAELDVPGGVAPEVHHRRGPAQDLLDGARRCACRGRLPAGRHWSGCSRNAFMPWEMALRVVSLPATDSSRKNRLKSMSDSDSPSTSALSSAVMMSSAGLGPALLGQLLRVHEHLDLGVERSPPR